MSLSCLSPWSLRGCILHSRIATDFPWSKTLPAWAWATWPSWAPLLASTWRGLVRISQWWWYNDHNDDDDNDIDDERSEDAAPLDVHRPPSPPVAGCPGQQTHDHTWQHCVSQITKGLDWIQKVTQVSKWCRKPFTKYGAGFLLL